MINKISFNPIFKSQYLKSSKISTNTINQNKSNFLTFTGINSKNSIEIQQTNNIKSYYEFLKRKGRVTKEEYFDIKANHPNYILKANKLTIKEANNEMLYTNPNIASKIIQILDFFKKDNSKVISVGTSPSFITEGMRALGKDIIFLPVSGGNWCLGKDTIKEYFEYYPNFKIVGDYLKYKGIAPDKLDKDVIILDYCATGRTIHLIERLIKEYCDVEKDKVFTQDLYDLILTGFSENQNNLTQNDIDNIKSDLRYQRVEMASNVPHFSIYSDKLNRDRDYSVSSKGQSKEKLFKKFEEYSRPSARAYQLLVLAELDKIGELKNNENN